MSDSKQTKTHDLYDLALRDRDMLPVLAIGTAGTGKTYGAVRAAAEWLAASRGNQFIGLRPNTSFAEKNGFLPGDERQKLDPWIRPIIQNFEYNKVSRSMLDNYERNGKVHFYMLEHVQGLTFDNAFILVDECQNLNMAQLRGLLTRQGKWSKVVLCGDVAQISPEFKNSGLPELLRMVDHFQARLHYINFTREDILRSAQCANWIEMFEDWDILKAKGEVQ